MFDLSSTRDLLERLEVDEKMRRLCGWSSARTVPSEATFPRAFAAFAESSLPSRLHEALAERTPTANAWLGILETSFIAFRLPALHANTRKRLVKMPKLHFYDSGLVCLLLGIRTPEQLRADPLRGPIFETWAVSDVTEHRANRGEAGGLSFFRDRKGAEVDLVVDNPIGTTVVEARSSETASSSLFDGSRRVRRHLARSTRQCAIVVVYGADQPQHRGTDSLIPWRELHELDRDVTDCIVTVRSAGRTVDGASVPALFPNKTWKNAVTDEGGTAILDLHSTHLPITVFVAANSYAAHLEDAWTPASGPLNVELTELSDGGAVIFPIGTGQVPLLRGRLNPILMTLTAHTSTPTTSPSTANSSNRRALFSGRTCISATRRDRSRWSALPQSSVVPPWWNIARHEGRGRMASPYR